MTEKEEQKWYADGLRFTCSECGDCCTGAPGFVWLKPAEIDALAERLELTVDEFERLYVKKVGARKSLKEFPNGDCVFFDSETKHCQVYEQRPIQCKTWPFWDSNLKDPQKWRETCEICPGSGKGKLYSIEEIEERRSKIKI